MSNEDLNTCIHAASDDIHDNVLSRDKGPKYIFSFGDSFTSTNFDINGAQPSPSEPMGNTDLGNHETSAQGPVWIQYLTTKYNTTATLTYNFAAGGASIPDHYTEQVQKLYKPKYSNSKFWLGSNTLFTSWVGINDVSDSWIQKDSGILLTRLDKYFVLLEELWNTGARNFFIANVPPLDRSPFIKGFDEDTVARYKTNIQIYNDNLATHVSKFRDAHPDGTIILYDVHTFFSKVMDDPKKYGFKDNCCGDAKGCMWAGGFHILSSFHDVIAKDMLDTIKKFEFTG